MKCFGRNDSPGGEESGIYRNEWMLGLLRSEWTGDVVK